MPDLRLRMPAASLLVRATGDVNSAAWYGGALGELVVAGILSNLGTEWAVLHSVPVGDGSSDIDHVVVGPPGVFTINSKAHVGKPIWAKGRGVTVTRDPVPYIPAAIHEAARASRLLSEASGLTVPVTPILVFVGAESMTVTEPLDGGVIAISSDALLATLHRRREFSDEQLHRIRMFALLPATWQTAPSDEPESRDARIRLMAAMANELVDAARGAAANASPSRRANLKPSMQGTRARRAPVPARSGKRRRSTKQRSNPFVVIVGAGAIAWYLYAIHIPSLTGG